MNNQISILTDLRVTVYCYLMMLTAEEIQCPKIICRFLSNRLEFQYEMFNVWYSCLHISSMQQLMTFEHVKIRLFSVIFFCS